MACMERLRFINQMTRMFDPVVSLSPGRFLVSRHTAHRMARRATSARRSTMMCQAAMRSNRWCRLASALTASLWAKLIRHTCGRCAHQFNSTLHFHARKIRLQLNNVSCVLENHSEHQDIPDQDTVRCLQTSCFSFSLSVCAGVLVSSYANEGCYHERDKGLVLDHGDA